MKKFAAINYKSLMPVLSKLHKNTQGVVLDIIGRNKRLTNIVNKNPRKAVEEAVRILGTKHKKPIKIIYTPQGHKATQGIGRAKYGSAPKTKDFFAKEPKCKVFGSAKKCDMTLFKKAEYVFNKLAQVLRHPVGNTVLDGAVKSPLTNGKYSYHTYAVQQVKRPEGTRYYYGEMPKVYDPGFGKTQAALNAQWTAKFNPADSITTKTYNNLRNATLDYRKRMSTIK